MTLETSDQVFELIEEVGQARGKKKESILAENLGSPLLMRVLKAALCPFTTYGVKKLPKPKGEGQKNFSDSTWSLLNRLRERKLTGNAAQEAIAEELGRLNEASQALLSRILKKDLRGGFTAKTVNRVKPGSIFVFECMLAQKYEQDRIKSWPVAVEEKFDGVRVIVMVASGVARFYSRTGKEFKGFDELGRQIVEALKVANLSDRELVFDGEIMTGQFNQTVGDVRRKSGDKGDAVIKVFEIMHRKTFESGGNQVPYYARRKTLESFIRKASDVAPSWHLSKHDLMHTHEEVMARHREILDRGGEGVIVKPLNGAYVCKRSYDWLKVKAQCSADCVIVGFEEGTGKYEGTLGALVVDFEGVRVRVSGMTDAEREEFWSNRDEYIGKLVEVHYHERTPDGSLRHPRFVRVRDDKPVEDGVGV